VARLREVLASAREGVAARRRREGPPAPR